MKKLLNQARRKNVDAVLLDLSRNGGGLLDDSVRISGLFLKQGGVVATRDARKRWEVMEDDDKGINFSGPLAILTSRRSASASEILAGALKDYGRALVIGDSHTFGKGTVQAVMPLPPGMGAIKVTTGMFFLPGGYSTQHLGVKADVVIPSVYDTDEIGEKALDYSLAQQKARSFVSQRANFKKDKNRRWDRVKTEFIPILSQWSQARTEKNEKFIDLKKKMKESKEDDGLVKLSEILKEQKKKKKEDPTSVAKAKAEKEKKRKTKKKPG